MQGVHPNTFQAQSFWLIQLMQGVHPNTFQAQSFWLIQLMQGVHPNTFQAHPQRAHKTTSLLPSLSFQANSFHTKRKHQMSLHIL
jgi:hypothetical protein